MHSSGFEPGTWAPINRPFVSAWGGAASADTDLDYCSYGYGALEVETLCGGRYRKVLAYSFTGHSFRLMNLGLCRLFFEVLILGSALVDCFVGCCCFLLFAGMD